MQLRWIMIPLLILLFSIIGTVSAQCYINGVYQCPADGNACTVDRCTWNPRNNSISCTYPPVDCADSDICTNDLCSPSGAFPFYQCNHIYLGCCCTISNMNDQQRREYLTRQKRDSWQRYATATALKFDPIRYQRKKQCQKDIRSN